MNNSLNSRPRLTALLRTGAVFRTLPVPRSIARAACNVETGLSKVRSGAKPFPVLEFCDGSRRFLGGLQIQIPNFDLYDAVQDVYYQHDHDGHRKAASKARRRALLGASQRCKDFSAPSKDATCPALAFVMRPVARKIPRVGSYSSALSVASNRASKPPPSSTLPLPRVVAVC